MNRKVVWATLAALLLVAVACTPAPAAVEAPAGPVTVLGTWGGGELESFQNVVFPFTEDTGIGMAFEGTRDLAAVLTTRAEAGNPPDLAVLPNPGQIAQFADNLVDLSTVVDMDAYVANFGQSSVEMGTYQGSFYGFNFKTDLKSLVWYNPDALLGAGMAVPSTWDDLIALSDDIVAAGGTPWCVGLESGAASGWPATDWIEDIMLRTAGPTIYDQWVAHEIPWTHPAVVTAFEHFGQIAGNDDYVFGGTTGVLTTFFGDSPGPMFDDPPGCYLHKQASFIPGFFPEGLTEADYAFFPFPEIDPAYGTPALISGDFVVMFNDNENSRALLNYLMTADAQQIWVERGSYFATNRNVSLDAYPDDTARSIAQALNAAEVTRFDGGDLMPAAVGSGTFWSGMLDFVGGEDVDSVLGAIEASAEDAYAEMMQ